MDVGAAAKLLAVEAARGIGVGNGDYAHAVFRVFVAEESEGSGGESVFERSDVGFDGGVEADLFVDLLLDVAEFVGIDGSEVRKIKTQAFGGVQRAGLFDVGAEGVAQRGVDE